MYICIHVYWYTGIYVSMFIVSFSRSCWYGDWKALVSLDELELNAGESLPAIFDDTGFSIFKRLMRFDRGTSISSGSFT